MNFVNIAGSSEFEATANKSFDEKVLEPFKNVLADTASNKLIVIHLMGSHATYSSRYPIEFDRFTDVENGDQLINEYDNSVLYNDFIVNEIFSITANDSKMKPKSLYSVIYLSDHGENVHDEGEGVGHTWANSIPKCNVEIPFVVWISPNYEAQKNLTIDESLPFVAEDLFYSMIDLNGISIEHNQLKRSLFNHSFNATRKRVLEDGKDYDLK